MLAVVEPLPLTSLTFFLSFPCSSKIDLGILFFSFDRHLLASPRFYLAGSFNSLSASSAAGISSYPSSYADGVYT